jgi:hypothetical protein
MSTDLARSPCNQSAEVSRLGFIDQLKLRAGSIIWFVLALGFLASLPVIFGWDTWVFLALLVVAALFAVPVAWLVRRMFHPNGNRSFLAHWIKAGVALWFILSIVVAAPIYYLATITETRPVTVPQATVTNGNKTVVFQGMVHIGSESFYKSVVYDMERAIADGYVLYYEGIQTSTKEGEEFLSKLSVAITGSAELAEGYRFLAEACGLKLQRDYFKLLESDQKARPKTHVNADVDALEMKREFERLMQTDPKFASANANVFKAEPSGGSDSGTSAVTQFIEWQRTGTEKQKLLAGVVCRGFMTMIRGTPENKIPGPLDPVIVDFRNRALAKRIVDDTHDKIYITYGAAHLPGVIALLKKWDPNWQVVSAKWMRTIEALKHLDGNL